MIRTLPSLGRSRPVAAAAMALAWAMAARADEPAFVLDLPDGGQLPGGFVERPAGDGPLETLGWRSPLFETPFEFRIDELFGIRSLDKAAAAGDAEGFSCRLRGGDVIDGELQAIDAREVVIVPPGGEALRIERGIVTSIARRKPGGMAGYVGPNGLAGWTQAPESSWQEEAGRITSAVANASVERDVGGPARARYDIVLAWRNRPELSLAVAAGDGKLADPYRFEMLAAGDAGQVAMIVRQGRQAAKLEPIALPADSRGRLQMTLFVDQVAGRLAAAVAGVDSVVDISVPAPAGQAPAGRFRLRLLSGDVAIERLRVSEWQSPEPVMGDPDMTRVALKSDEAMDGEIVSLEAGSLVVKAASGERRIPLADVDEIAFAAAGGRGESDEEPAGVRLVRRGGGVLTGDVVAVAAAGLVMNRRGIDRPVSVPLSDLQSLNACRTVEPRSLPGRSGTLRVGDAEVPGCLVDAAASGGGLAWQPRGSLAASRLAGDAAATVDYVPRAEPAGEAQGGQVEIGGIGAGVNLEDAGFFIITMLAEEGAAARDGRIQPGDRILAIRPARDSPFVETKGLETTTVMNLLRGRVGAPVSLRVGREGEEPQRIDLVRGLIYVAERQVLDEALAAHARIVAGQAAAEGQAAGFPAQVVLRSGDVVPAEVDRVDEAGVRMRSPATASGGQDAVVVPHSLVRAVELNPAAASRGIERLQWERLLTLPRSQQADPPTHLLRLTSGDYLRGRLEAIDAEGVRFTVLGQSKRLPRAAVVRIIWLHGDEIEGRDEKPEPAGDAAAAAAAAPPGPPAEGLLVQGISASGGRTTLFAERMEGPTIVGTSLALGASRIDTRKIDRLLIDRAVGAGDGELPFAKWKLRLAPLPRALRDDQN